MTSDCMKLEASWLAFPLRREMERCMKCQRSTRAWVRTGCTSLATWIALTGSISCLTGARSLAPTSTPRKVLSSHPVSWRNPTECTSTTRICVAFFRCSTSSPWSKTVSKTPWSLTKNQAARRPSTRTLARYRRGLVHAAARRLRRWQQRQRMLQRRRLQSRRRLAEHQSVSIR